MAKIFTKSSDTAMLDEDQEGRAILEEYITTYQVKKEKNKFIIFELQRKRSPRRVKTIKAVKGQKIDHVIQDVKSGRIKLKEKISNVIEGKISKLTISQTNYKARIKTRPRLKGLVRVSDIKRQLYDHFIGYSERINNAFPTKAEINKAKNTLKKMAISRFISIYGLAGKSDDIHAEIIELRYVYFKKQYKNV